MLFTNISETIIFLLMHKYGSVFVVGLAMVGFATKTSEAVLLELKHGYRAVPAVGLASGLFTMTFQRLSSSSLSTGMSRSP